MKSVNINRENKGFIYTIKGVVNSTDLQCPRSCFYYEREGDEVCDYILSCHKLGIEINKNKNFSCLKVLVNVKNMGNCDDWFIGAEDILLIDSEGFSYKGMILCDKLITFKISEDGTNILPGTQVNYIQLFPQIPSDVKISKFKVNIYNSWFDFNMSDEENSVEKIHLEHSADYNEHSLEKAMLDENELKYELSNIKHDIKNLKTTIYSCLNNELTSTERTKLVNTIKNRFYSIKLDLEEKKDSAFVDLNSEVLELEKDFDVKINVRKEEQRKRGAAQKIEDLLALTPREFEEYVGQLYKSMGYDVEVTQYSNDKGVDVVMYKDGIKYVIQCKRYKGTVGSPDIQKFIGAIDHAKADKGIFVTTGMFSFEAEKMAKEHPIVLVNRIDLAKLIVNELSK